MSENWLFKRSPRFFGYLFGSTVAGTFMAALVLPGSNVFHAPGSLNFGHEKLGCVDCHRASQGTMRQQLQAKMRFTLGLRVSDVPFGNAPVANETCLDCHGRPVDHHPSYRFSEPRFARARRETGAHRCTSCHQEHQGVRIAVADIGYCRSCHKDTVLKKDPLDTPHKTLFEKGQWNTCLGCHDFHGNHEMKVAREMKEVIDENRIRQYFDGTGAQIYSEEKKFSAETELRREDVH